MDLTDLLPQTAAVAATLAQTKWAEDEITAGQDRHPDQADLLYHCFTLLKPTTPPMTTQFVYRAHCRELLDRMAEAGDPREPTNAEIAIGCAHVSLVIPLSRAAMTLYMRAWSAAFPDQPAFTNLGLEHYEHVAGTEADQLMAATRRWLRQPQRQLPPITCPGRHHGQPRPHSPYTTNKADP
jgi:hypothetical protein